MPASKEFHQVEVPEPLKLLPDFVAHVKVFGVKALEAGGTSINLDEGELRAPDVPDEIQHIERPAA